MLYRTATNDDYIQAVPYLAQAIVNAPVCQGMPMDLESMIAYLLQTQDGGYIVDEKYLVCFTVTNPWYAPTTTAIHEQLVLNIAPDKPGTLFGPVRFFVEKKAEYDCTHVFIGDLLHSDREKYGRVLTKLGLYKINTIYSA